MCNCFSYNAQEGETPNVILDPNKYFESDGEMRTVCVDACIVEQIKDLWKAGIWTSGCCCSHNGLFQPDDEPYIPKLNNPSVIIASHENPERAKKILKESNPDRKWIVQQWQLITT